MRIPTFKTLPRGAKILQEFGYVSGESEPSPLSDEDETNPEEAIEDLAYNCEKNFKEANAVIDIEVKQVSFEEETGNIFGSGHINRPGYIAEGTAVMLTFDE